MIKREGPTRRLNRIQLRSAAKSEERREQSITFLHREKKVEDHSYSRCRNPFGDTVLDIIVLLFISESVNDLGMTGKMERWCELLTILRPEAVVRA